MAARPRFHRNSSPDLSASWPSYDAKYYIEFSDGGPSLYSEIPKGEATGNHDAWLSGEAGKEILVPFPADRISLRTLGLLASIGHHTGVARVFGINFSGFAARWMWRTVYLAKLPRLANKFRVMVDWTLDLFFGREIEQMVTLRDAEVIADRLARVHARTIQRHKVTVTPVRAETSQLTASS